MLRHHLSFLLPVASLLVLAACGSGRYVSADPDLEAIYEGKSYYEVVADFGEPDARMKDGLQGTKIAYNAATLNGTRAAELYRRYTMRNRATKVAGMPNGGLTFSFDSDLKCYAVQSDFEHVRVKQPKQHAAKAQDPRRPNAVPAKVPRMLELPYVERRNPHAELVSIDRVAVEENLLRVYFTYKDRTPTHRPPNDISLYVMPEVYVEDCATHKRYKVVDAEGISFYPERTKFAHNDGGYDVLSYALVFEPVATTTEFINIVEPGHSGFSFYGVDIRTPITTKEDLKNSITQ